MKLTRGQWSLNVTFPSRVVTVFAGTSPSTPPYSTLPSHTIYAFEPAINQRSLPPPEPRHGYLDREPALATSILWPAYVGSLLHLGVRSLQLRGVSCRCSARSRTSSSRLR